MRTEESPPEPSSGPERSTAGAAGGCCPRWRRAVERGWINPDRHTFPVQRPEAMLQSDSGDIYSVPIHWCPWCGERLGEG